MTIGPKIVLSVLLAGWLADLLASRDRDVEAGIEAYEAGELESALSHFDAAIERHGDRNELSFNRGLVLLAQADLESAQRAFQHASQAEDYQVRGSALYELGNIALDAEDYEAAIASYIECLKARPDHENAKWNLELALKKRAEQEKKEEEEKKKDEENEDEENEDEENKDEENKDDENKDDENKDDEQEQGESGEQQPPDEASGGEQEPQPPQGTGGEEPEPEPEPESEPEPEPQPEPEPETDKDDEGKQQPTPAPVQQMDIDKALEELDAQDAFLLDRPPGRTQTPVQDW